jgi:hypothetical protein
MRWLPVLATILYSVTAVAADDWGAIQFLVGRWTGAGSGAPGQGTGGFSFLPNLRGRVLVRKNFAEYPSTKDFARYIGATARREGSKARQ